MSRLPNHTWVTARPQLCWNRDESWLLDKVLGRCNTTLALPELMVWPGTRVEVATDWDVAECGRTEVFLATVVESTTPVRMPAMLPNTVAMPPLGAEENPAYFKYFVLRDGAPMGASVFHHEISPLRILELMADGEPRILPNTDREKR